MYQNSQNAQNFEQIKINLENKQIYSTSLAYRQFRAILTPDAFEWDLCLLARMQVTMQIDKILHGHMTIQELGYTAGMSQFEVW